MKKIFFIALLALSACQKDYYLDDLNAANEEIASLEYQNNQLNQEISGLARKISSFQVEINALNNEVQSNEDYISVLQSNAIERDQWISELTIKNDSLISTITYVQSELALIQDRISNELVSKDEYDRLLEYIAYLEFDYSEAVQQWQINWNELQFYYDEDFSDMLKDIYSLQPYLDYYNKKAVEHGAAPIAYNFKITFEDLNPDRGGDSNSCVDGAIRINNLYWNDPTTPLRYRIELLFHELGHSHYIYTHPLNSDGSVAEGFSSHSDFMGYSAIDYRNWDSALERFFNGTNHAFRNCSTGKASTVTCNIH